MERKMGKVTAHMSMSLDGFIAGPNDAVENPLGDGGDRVHEWAFELENWRQRQGLVGGEINRDAEILDDTMSHTGAVVMGRRMFSNGAGPWGETPFQGHWGDDPPFRVPVFVLTHHARERLVKDGGTTFTFVTDGIEAALTQAQAVAGDRNVAIAGGASVVQQGISARLLDKLLIHLSPVLLGDGIRLLDHLGTERIELDRTLVVDSPKVTHLRFRFRNS